MTVFLAWLVPISVKAEEHCLPLQGEAGRAKTQHDITQQWNSSQRLLSHQQKQVIHITCEWGFP